MCGRVIQKSNPEAIRRLFEAIPPAPNAPPRYNGAPSQKLMVIRRNPETGKRTLELLQWGLIPHWMKEANGGRKPINARAETITTLPTFRSAYAKRRCLLPIDGFYEWLAIKDQKAKQPYALAMKDRSVFAIAGIWENWKSPSGEDVRTFAVITCKANEMVAEIHDRMPVIIAKEDYEEWLSSETNPGELLRPYPAELMTMWPVSTRVNSPRNEDSSLIEEIN